MFHNLDPTIKPKGLKEFLKWQFTTRRPKWPKAVQIPKTDTPPPKVIGDKIRVSFVGHVTFLLQFEGLNIITDPVWSKTASPFSFIGPKRITPPGIRFNDLSKIDYILVSHNHYDHMDIPTIKELCRRDNPVIVAPLMNEITIKKHIPQAKVITLNWFEKDLIENNIEICLEPAQHWSARGLFDRNEALWGTFIIKTPSGSICFIGDTGYSKQMFTDIGNKYDILLSLLPIGAFEPRWFMQGIHMNPEEAVLAHQDLRSKYSIASHFNTFPLAADDYNQALEEFKTARDKYRITEGTFIAPQVGEVYWF